MHTGNVLLVCTAWIPNQSICKQVVTSLPVKGPEYRFVRCLNAVSLSLLLVHEKHKTSARAPRNASAETARSPPVNWKTRPLRWELHRSPILEFLSLACQSGDTCIPVESNSYERKERNFVVYSSHLWEVLKDVRRLRIVVLQFPLRDFRLACHKLLVYIPGWWVPASYLVPLCNAVKRLAHETRAFKLLLYLEHNLFELRVQSRNVRQVLTRRTPFFFARHNLI